METSAITLQFPEFPALFTARDEYTGELQSDIGDAVVSTFKLARGIELRFWHAYFRKNICLQGDVSDSKPNRQFTLLIFLTTDGVELIKDGRQLTKQLGWNTLFLSSKCNYKLELSPSVFNRCMSISFSRTWFQQNVLGSNRKLHKLAKTIGARENFAVIGCLKPAEMTVVHEMFDVSWKKSFGIFYLKTRALKLVSDFMHKMKDREAPTVNNLCVEAEMPELKKYSRRQLV